MTDQEISILKQQDRFLLADTYDFRLKHDDIGLFLVKREHTGGRESEIVVAMSKQDDFLALESAFLAQFPNEKQKLATGYAFRHGPAAYRQVIRAEEEKQQGHAGRIDGERKDKGPRQPGG